jgi:CRP-like cAMP-binding protein
LQTRGTPRAQGCGHRAPAGKSVSQNNQSRGCDVDVVEPRSDPARAAVLDADRRPGAGIADSVVKRRFRRGELVVEQGRKSNALFILLNGRARVLTSDTRGREVILAVLESGDYVGEMSLIDNEPHSATVRAEVQTDMLVLGRADFARCLPEGSTSGLRHPARPGARLRNADRQIESLALLDVYGRVARTLLDMAEDDNGVKIIRTRCRARTWPRSSAPRARWSAG